MEGPPKPYLHMYVWEVLVHDVTCTVILPDESGEVQTDQKVRGHGPSAPPTDQRSYMKLCKIRHT